MGVGGGGHGTEVDVGRGTYSGRGGPGKALQGKCGPESFRQSEFK